jgi:hypothetical protein
MRHQCRICLRKFSTSSGLTRHSNAVHHGRTTLSQTNEPRYQYQQSDAIPRPEHDEGLWNEPITMIPTLRNNPILDDIEMEESEDETRGQAQEIEYDEGLWNVPITMPTLTTPDDDDIDMEKPSEDIQTQEIESITENESQPRYNLRSQTQNVEVKDNIEDSETEENENTDDSETELHLPMNLEPDIDFDDLQGASLDDALDTIEGKNRIKRIARWPNKAYHDFMELIEGNISNRIGDKIIKFFNKHSNLRESPLPNLTKNGKNYLNQINSPSLDFKEKLL